MTVAHKNLTGSDLHEPKGVDVATANKVYVSDGAGSGVWQKVDRNQLEKTGNPFGSNLLHIKDLKPQNTAGQSFTGTTWTKVDLTDIITNEITSASLSSSQISLPSGTYYIEVDKLIYGNSANGKLRLRNITDGSDLIANALNQGFFSGDTQTLSLKGRFTLAATKTIEIQALTSVNTTSPSANISGYQECYADVLIWKVA